MAGASRRSVTFLPLPPPTDDDIAALTLRIVRRTVRILARRDAQLVGDPELDPLDSARAEAVSLPRAAARPRIATARRRRCALVDGFSLHADTSVDAADRDALERLARYVLRPAISADRVTIDGDGRVQYQFRHPDPTGRTSWVTDGPTLCRRLATLIPPRRSHTTRFHGVLSWAHHLRSRIVPAPAPTADAQTECTGIHSQTLTAMTPARRLDWAALLHRVHRVDVTTCPRCGDSLRVIAFVAHPDIAIPILEYLGLASNLPSVAPARAPPDDSELDLLFPDS